MTDVSKQLETTVRHLSETIGPRAPGSAKEREASHWVAQQFRNLGYTPVIEEFACPAHGADDASISGIDDDVAIFPTQHTPTGTVRGELEWLGFGEDCFLDAVAGKIGLLMMDLGLVERHELMDRLEALGMSAVIVVSPYADTINGKVVRSGRLERMLTTTVSISDARKLRRNVGRQVTLEVTGSRPERMGISQNVIAELKGDTDNMLVVCGHCDSAACGPGARDDGSGIAMLLELAKRFAGKTLGATIHFVATGAEEFGGRNDAALGAKVYFDHRVDTLDKYIGCLAMDDVADSLGVRTIRKLGPKTFVDAVADFEGVCKAKDPRDIGTDGAAAYRHGVANVDIMDRRETNPWYHGPMDTADGMDFEALAAMTNVAGTIIESLAALEPPYRYTRRDDLLIRPARWDDIDAILDITRDAFGPVSKDRINEDFFGEALGGRPWHAYKLRGVRAMAERFLDRFIVAQVDDQVVGYASYAFDEERGVAEVCNNAVRPAYQRRGIGKAMQGEIMARFAEEGYGRWAVTTLSNDVPAQKMYAKMGFAEVIRSIHYLRKQEEMG